MSEDRADTSLDADGKEWVACPQVRSCGRRELIREAMGR